MTIKVGKYVCGFCLTNTHQYCPGVVKGKEDTLVACPCECEKTLRCKVCGNEQADEVDPDRWVCTDFNACMHELDIKRQRAKEMLYPKGFERTPRKEGKNCNCGCGESTSGGMFKPGHADKLVAMLAKEIKAGNKELEEVINFLADLSDGLLKKLEARI